jgi:hypothetical protein
VIHLTLLAQVQPLLGQNFEWVFQHLQVIGWPVLVAGLWKLIKFLNKLEMQFTKTIGQIDTLSTNHFPHMQESLQNQDRLMKSMDESLKLIANQTSKIKTPRKK